MFFPNIYTGTAWTIQTVTGDDTGEGTGSAVELHICEEDGHSKSIVIGERQDFIFKIGATDTFHVSFFLSLHADQDILS